MEFNVGDLLTVEGVKYITLEKLTHENTEYAFVNKVTDEEEITNEYYIFKVMNNGIRVVLEENLKNILLPKFQTLLQNHINELNQEDN